MISRDTGCRPHEILKLRIKDVVLRLQLRMKEIAKYAEVLVNGKTGSRHIPLSIPFPMLKIGLTNILSREILMHH
jgi:hypothetical protein